MANYPELMAPPPVPYGQQPQVMGKISSLLRQQLVDLAMAFGLEDQIPRDGTKDQILPFMLAAEARGDFKKPSRRPWYLWKASKTSDDIKKMIAEGETIPTMESMPDREIVEPGQPEQWDPNSVQGMRQRCKSLGINSFGKGKAEMAELLARYDMGLETLRAASQPVPEKTVE